jgi:hypothetical protein
MAATWVVVSDATWLFVSARISADVKPETSVVGVTMGGPLYSPYPPTGYTLTAQLPEPTACKSEQGQDDP